MRRQVTSGQGSGGDGVTGGRGQVLACAGHREAGQATVLDAPTALGRAVEHAAGERGADDTVLGGQRGDRVHPQPRRRWASLADAQGRALGRQHAETGARDDRGAVGDSTLMAVQYGLDAAEFVADVDVMGARPACRDDKRRRACERADRVDHDRRRGRPDLGEQRVQRPGHDLGPTQLRRECGEPDSVASGPSTTACPLPCRRPAIPRPDRPVAPNTQMSPLTLASLMSGSGSRCRARCPPGAKSRSASSRAARW